jgi:hypothetical protein
MANTWHPSEEIYLWLFIFLFMIDFFTKIYKKFLDFTYKKYDPGECKSYIFITFTYKNIKCLFL